MADQYRPISFDEFIGQKKLKDRLSIHINGALSRMEMLPHILLTGPAGSGKSSLAELIAKEMGLPINNYVCPIKPVVLRNIMMGSEYELVFLDEFHRLSNKQQEELLTILHDGYYQMDNGYRIDNDTLTFVAATSEKSKILDTILQRFTIKPKFEEYTDRQMGLIVAGMAQKMGLELTKEQTVTLGKATGGVPRNGKTLIQMVLDSQLTDMDLVIQKCGLTKDGLTEDHLDYLEVLQKSGGQAGLDLIAAHLQLSKTYLIDLERLLLKRKMISYSKQGRMIMPAGVGVIKKGNENVDNIRKGSNSTFRPYNNKR